jgi:hypothetical protein
MFKKVLLGAVAAGMTLASVTAANASGGCGINAHRGPYGGCRPNYYAGGPAVVVGPGIVRIGVFYPGRGYWDGHRYWGHRYAWHGGWRYR